LLRILANLGIVLMAFSAEAAADPQTALGLRAPSVRADRWQSGRDRLRFSRIGRLAGRRTGPGGWAC